MTRYRHQSFTLIELLVVVAIIAILASLLLPSLSAAREKSRRSVCLSNLKQVYTAAFMYNDDYDGNVPHHWSNPKDGSLSTECCEYNNGITPYTAWRSWHMNGYISLDMYECPSMGSPPDIRRNKMGIHYSFRYNSRRVVSYGGDKFPNEAPPRNILTDPTRSDKVLFTDAVRMRRHKNNAAIVVTQNIDYYSRRWAHEIGGHMMAHAGYAIWLPNRYPKWPAHWYGGGLWTTLDTYKR